MCNPDFTGSRLLRWDRKDGILGVSEPEGAIPIAAVLTDKPEHEGAEVPQPKQVFAQSFHSLFKSRRNLPTNFSCPENKPGFVSLVICGI